MKWCNVTLSQLSGGSSISSSRSLMGVLNRADFLNGAFGVCTPVTPCDTKQHKNRVKTAVSRFLDRTVQAVRLVSEPETSRLKSLRTLCTQQRGNRGGKSFEYRVYNHPPLDHSPLTLYGAISDCMFFLKKTLSADILYCSASERNVHWYRSYAFGP